MFRVPRVGGPPPGRCEAGAGIGSRSRRGRRAQGGLCHPDRPTGSEGSQAAAPPTTHHSGPASAPVLSLSKDSGRHSVPCPRGRPAPGPVRGRCRHWAPLAPRATLPRGCVILTDQREVKDLRLRPPPPEGPSPTRPKTQTSTNLHNPCYHPSPHTKPSRGATQ